MLSAGFGIIGFVLMLRSTITLNFAPGPFHSDEYVDPKTDAPPPHIESSPRPWLYRPGIILILIGLVLQMFALVIGHYPNQISVLFQVK